MCGIIHVKKLDPNKKACKTVRKRFEAQRTRGTDGFGFVEIKNGVVVGVHRARTEKEIMKKLMESTAEEILFHHRIPTSTPNFVEATHPIFVSNKLLKHDYYVIHNGVISNDDAMREDHLKLGFEYTTDITTKYETAQYIYTGDVIWNDSEAMAIDFAWSVERNVPMDSVGSIALIALQVEKGTGKVLNLMWGRNLGNPLKMQKNDELFSLSSETGESVDDDKLFVMNYETFEIVEIKKEIGEYHGYKGTYGGNYGGYNWSKEKDDDKKIGFHFKDDDTKKLGSGKGYADGYGYAEEDDYTLDTKEELEWLKVEYKKALDDQDYDTAVDLQIQIEELETFLKAYAGDGSVIDLRDLQ